MLTYSRAVAECNGLQFLGCTEDLYATPREALALHRAAEQARMHELERVKEDMETGRWYDASTGEGTLSQLFRLLDRAAAALRNDE